MYKIVMIRKGLKANGLKSRVDCLSSGSPCGVWYNVRHGMPSIWT